MCFTCLCPPYESRKDLELFSSLFITVIELDVKLKKTLQLLIDCFVFYAVLAIFQEPAVTLLEYCRYGVKHKTTNHSLLQIFFLLNLTSRAYYCMNWLNHDANSIVRRDTRYLLTICTKRHLFLLKSYYLQNVFQRFHLVSSLNWYR